ncbi:hypothetical protein [Saccharopolyspora pogona]|uniref:hypothetical protein n=1 Tax=Saccharopolyspora pogona TaxID=333966 RepID=UPI0016883F38|nr:hypothetical protein [Saccharopolyspora pogona]
MVRFVGLVPGEIREPLERVADAGSAVGAELTARLVIGDLFERSEHAEADLVYVNVESAVVGDRHRHITARPRRSTSDQPSPIEQWHARTFSIHTKTSAIRGHHTWWTETYKHRRAMSTRAMNRLRW